ncbi:MAG: hypothetical protein E7289_09355 [Lachnospiraceae bacterium]|nr:hypothetical protein [Lachnospiraceae bacterium]
MKQAYLITAYKDAASLFELAGLFTQTGYVYIHIDKKSKTITDDDIEKLNHIPGCVAIRKYDIKWGGFNHVKAILELIMMAVSNHDVAYMHMLTGEDFPLVSPQKLDEMFLSDSHIYMSYIKPEDLPEAVTVRYRYYNWFQDKNVKNKALWMLQHMTVLLQKRCGVFREGIGEFNRIYKGLVYISMPKEAAAYVVEYVARHEEFWEDLYKCQVPEEFFFQTIFMNNNEWSEKVTDRELRYMDWSRGDGSSPAYLTEADYDKVKASGCLFARKFHPEMSLGLREKLREEIGITE